MTSKCRSGRSNNREQRGRQVDSAVQKLTTGFVLMGSARVSRKRNAEVIVGVDPSMAMLAQARQWLLHPRVQYVVGDAAAVPIAGGLFDLALLSRVIHHLPDRRSCARELKRILRPSGVVVIRTTFRGHLDAPVYDYWPRLRDCDVRQFPSEQEVLDDFRAEGFELQVSRSFSQPVTRSLCQYHHRLSMRPQSKLRTLTDSEFEDWLHRLELDAEAEPVDRPTPVPERYDVVVFAGA
jgi:ubiquinone/menaquinone biosynthesis C-methylase UbiE